MVHREGKERKREREGTEEGSKKARVPANGKFWRERERGRGNGERKLSLPLPPSLPPSLLLLPLFLQSAPFQRSSTTGGPLLHLLLLLCQNLRNVERKKEGMGEGGERKRKMGAPLSSPSPSSHSILASWQTLFFFLLPLPPPPALRKRPMGFHLSLSLYLPTPIRERSLNDLHMWSSTKRHDSKP